MNNHRTPQGMTTFILVAVGQIVSVTGSALTGFALGAWVYQQTRSTTQFSLILLFTVLPSLLFALPNPPPGFRGYLIKVDSMINVDMLI